MVDSILIYDSIGVLYSKSQNTVPLQLCQRKARCALEKRILLPRGRRLYSESEGCTASQKVSPSLPPRIRLESAAASERVSTPHGALVRNFVESLYVYESEVLF